MVFQNLLSRFTRLTRLTPWAESTATIIYCGTEKIENWQTVVRYQYSFESKVYEGVRLFAAKQNINSQMDARLLADKLVRQYPIGSQHRLKVHKKKAWKSKLF